METRTGKVVLYPCSVCDLTFTVTQDMKAHMMTHEEEKPFTCPFCNECFRRKYLLVIHKRIHKAEKGKDDEEKSFICPFCNKCFRKNYLLVKHKRIHKAEKGKDDEEKPFICPFCNECFRKEYLLIKHKRLHKAINTNHCPLCQMTFRSIRRLCDHLYTHIPPDMSPYSCSVCGSVFTKPVFLMRHLMAQHTGGKHHECSVCEKHFTRLEHLNSHMRSHTGERPFECIRCKKRYFDSGSLQKHMRIHTGYKPYQCDVCGRRFSQSVHLRTHKMNHMGVKPFKCSFCERSFVRKEVMIGHMATHTGEKPFECSICKERFRNMNGLCKHIKRLHKKEHPALSSVKNSRVVNVSSLKKVQSYTDSSDVKNSVQSPIRTPVLNQSCGANRTTIKSETKSNCLRIKPDPDLCHCNEQRDLFRCYTCVKGFSCIEDLQKHLLMYICSRCDTCVTGFIQVADLQNHVATHLGSQVELTKSETSEQTHQTSMDINIKSEPCVFQWEEYRIILNQQT